ncbi:fatty acyl-AMP ligase [Candidatus Uabimicrobium sp. HlEnr_7]|uniref:fatty acyl-AMP ligase n=1 Tax=Candidatus Uabimicrobium helgolandensis TaxID=3095367 RepID=UPI003558697F
MENSTLQVTNLVDLLCKRGELHPEKLAFKFLRDGENDTVDITYGELDQQAKAIAAFLQKAGMANKRVLLLYPSCIEYISAFFGCLYAGAIAIPAYPPDPMRLSKTLPRLQTILDDAECSMILTSSQVLSFFKKIALAQSIGNIPILGKLGKKISSRFDFPNIDMKTIEWLPTDNIDQKLHRDWQYPDISSETIAFLQYTSGSTGDPKGVILTHGNLLHNQKFIAEYFDECSVVISWLPLYHDMGLIGKIMQPIYCGGHCVFMSPLHFLQKPIRWLQAISKYKGTTSCAPNFAYDLCVRKVRPEQKKELDLSSWIVAGNGAEVIQKNSLDNFYECFKECGFQEKSHLPCYGLAEASLIASGIKCKEYPRISYFNKNDLLSNTVTSCNAEDKESTALVSCGTTQEEQQIIIVNRNTFELCSEKVIGEVWLRGPSVSQGYWNKPEISKEIFGARPANCEGEEKFLRTGDLGFLHNGDLYITGRVKDLIIIAGSNYYPQDIERTIEDSHPAVRKGCVAAFSCLFDNEEKLVVVLEVKDVLADTGRIKNILSKNKDKYPIDDVSKKIRRAINENHQLAVKDIVLLPPRTISKTSSGKIQRNACKQNYLQNKLPRL